jgi:hypothetical protein
LQRQAGLAHALGNRCDGFVFDIGHEATAIGVGMLDGGLPWEGADKGLHKSLEARQNLLAQVRGHLAFVQSWALTHGVSRFHGMLLLGLVCFANSQKALISHNLTWVNLKRQSK